MSIGINSKYLQKALESNRELADFYVDTKIDNDYRSTSIEFDETPLKYLEIIHVSWAKSLKKDTPKNEEEIGWELKREIERFDAFTKRLEPTTTKLKNKAKSLLELSSKIKAYLEKNLGERSWVYMRKGDTLQPYLVRSVTYFPKDSYRDRAEIRIDMVINSKMAHSSRSVTIDTDDMREHRRDVVEVLKATGMIFESKELYKTYRKDEKYHNQVSQWQNLQVVYKGRRYINDNNHKVAETSDRSKPRTTTHFDADNLMEVPLDLIIYCYNLAEHSFEWVTSSLVTKYEYDKTIEQKLILPSAHKNLINILLSDNIKELGSDIIAGKGAGTLILTKGKAGLGKTATAEIYSENKEVALLSVHSGQLGTSGDAIEKKLKVFFELAERWGCILLIDEADVYIRKRGDDVNHNAIVATFLRTMEYYGGTMFMTTNREDDVDEAIESRCIAVLSYDLPSQEMTDKLWALFTKQYNVTITDETMQKVTTNMNKLSGRDIKNITMLVSRYSQGMEIAEPDFDVFKLCATFRGKYKIGGEHE